MKGVFISYRRSDAAATSGRLCDHFAALMPAERVFHDVGSIEAGADFAAAIADALSNCDTVLVVIGHAWAAPDAAGARLREPDDFVRIEVEKALAAKITVVPVLVDGAPMPTSNDLPEPLAPLTRLNAFELRNARFADDADRLFQIATGRAPRRGPSPVARAGWAAAGAALGLALYVAAGAVHKVATGLGLDATLGRGLTTMLFAVFALGGAAAAWRLTGGRGTVRRD